MRLESDDGECLSVTLFIAILPLSISHSPRGGCLFSINFIIYYRFYGIVLVYYQQYTYISKYLQYVLTRV